MCVLVCEFARTCRPQPARPWGANKLRVVQVHKWYYRNRIERPTATPNNHHLHHFNCLYDLQLDPSIPLPSLSNNKSWSSHSKHVVWATAFHVPAKRWCCIFTKYTSTVFKFARTASGVGGGQWEEQPSLNKSPHSTGEAVPLCGFSAPWLLNKIYCPEIRSSDAELNALVRSHLVVNNPPRGISSTCTTCT